MLTETNTFLVKELIEFRKELAAAKVRLNRKVGRNHNKLYC